MSDDKGFSLVEIIIVIAIMAILVAILAPQYIKYVEKTRVTTDEQIAAAVHDALAVAITDENIEERPLSGFAPNSQVKLEDIGVTTDKPYTEFIDEVKAFLQTDDLSSIHNRFQSKVYKGQDILVEVDAASQTVIVTVNYNDGSGALVYR